MRAKIGAMVAAAAAAASAAGATVWARRRRGEADAAHATTSKGPAGAGKTPTAEAAETAPPTQAPTDADDLTSIKGLGAVSQGRLQEAGVTTLAQIAAWDDAAIEEIGQRIKVSPERIRREDWVGQARARAEG